MSRFYAELSVTIYAMSSDEADQIAAEVVAHLETMRDYERVGSVELVDLDADPEPE